MDTNGEVAVEETSEPSGFFHPESVFWRVNRENVLMLGAGAALLLQIAHPLVAAGVDEHSDFRRRPWRRLYRTLRPMQHLLFGDRESARAAASRVNRVHHRVRGARYQANDPELKLWVFATLIEASLDTYDAFLPALGIAKRAEYYEGSLPLARLFGIPDSTLPGSYPAFRSYYLEMVEGSTLDVTEPTVALASSVLHPSAVVPGFVEEWNETIAAALLPAAVRERYQLRWDEARKLQWRRIQDFVRRTLPRLPDVLRAAPAAQWAELRFRYQRRPSRPAA